MIGAAALSLLLQTAAPAAGRASNEIVVTARPLAETEREWKDCRKRRCPPDQEIAAALAHGENLFVSGDYQRAYGVLSATIASTRGAAARFPVELGDLRRAEARVSMHMGEDVLTRRGMLASKEALAKGLGKDDARVLAQRLQVADAMMIQDPRPMPTGFARDSDSRAVALRTYRAVASDARRLQLPDLEGRALLRIASLLVDRAAHEARGAAAEARAAIRRITETTDPRLAPFREAAALLSAKLDVKRGDPTSVDRLVAAYTGPRGKMPVLLYAPPIDWNASRDRTASRALAAVAQNAAQQVDFLRSDEWVDIAFHISPEGRVEDVGTVRTSTGRLGDWIEPVLAAIRQRRYAPMALDDAAPVLSRVERHTYTASWSMATGSGIRRQTGLPRVVVTDMTADLGTSAKPAG